MKNLEFPIIGTRLQAPGAQVTGGQAKGSYKTFDISSPSGRKKYFEAKVGDEIWILAKQLAAPVIQNFTHHKLEIKEIF